MKVEGCAIEFEHRYELDLFQDMIQTYLESGKKLPHESDKKDLEKIKNDLESLWMCW